MRLISLCSRIIGLMFLAAALQGCGMVKVAYNQAPDALYWWLDGYFDFKETQSLRLRADLDSFQAWHRRNELPAYADLLQKAEKLAPGNVTHDQMCELFSAARSRAIAALDRLEPTVAAIAPTLAMEQISTLEKQFDKRNRKWRADSMDGPLARRLNKRVKEAVNRAEHFYGNLEDRQLAVIRNAITGSSYDPQLTYREAVRRQQDALATLRAMHSHPPTETRARADMRALLDRSLNSPDASYRTYLAAITREGCAAVAELHNTTTPAQRAKAASVLRGYEDDFRALAAVK